MIVTLITIVHVIVCAFIIIVVLLQSGKAGDIASVFGGAGSQTAFGARGAANLLEKATTWSAVIFMLTSITLSIYASRRSGGGSVLEGLKPGTTQSQPAPPATPATPAPTAPAQK
ncbi:MAG: preprotein translocase subunit SecG [Terriglobales bacterium]